jgi:uncharacterized protein (TIGR00725 family)
MSQPAARLTGFSTRPLPAAGEILRRNFKHNTINSSAMADVGMKNRRKTIIGVIGASSPSAAGAVLAEEVGRLLAGHGVVLVCGGLGGVMESAARGCAAAGGEVLGILPAADAAQANPYVSLAVATNMGHARNVIIAHTAQALIAVEGEYGTLSEMAIALKLGKAVIVLPGTPQLPGSRCAATPAEAVRQALASVSP